MLAIRVLWLIRGVSPIYIILLLFIGVRNGAKVFLDFNIWSDRYRKGVWKRIEVFLKEPTTAPKDNC